MCESCPLIGGRKVPADGNISAPLVLVGEAPGYNEEKYGRPFIGDSGQFLDSVLKEVGLKRSDIYITNVVKCRPPQNKLTEPMYKACLPHFLEELKTLGAKHILAVGNTALRALTGHKGIMKYRGQMLPGKYTEAQVFATLHPAAGLYQPSNKPIIQNDFRAFVKIATGAWSPASMDLTYTLITKKNVHLLQVAFYKATEVSYDIETGLGRDAFSLDMRDPRNDILSIAFACRIEERAQVFVCSDFWPGFWKILKAFMEKKEFNWTAQNAWYDNHFLHRKEVNVRTENDTLLLSHLVDENMPHNLEFLCTSYLKVPAWKGDIHVDMEQYNGRDALYTLYLRPVLEGLLTERQRNLYHNLIQPAARVFERIERNGIFVHKERMDSARRDLEVRLAEADTELREYLPPAEDPWWKTLGTKKGAQEVNWNPSAFLSSFTFTYLRMPVIGRTKAGKASIDKAVIDSFTEMHPFFISLQAYRETANTLKFFDTWDNFLVKESDGWRMHPHYRMTGTVTGRLSAVEPAVQQIPREGLVRTCFGAPEGWSFLAADYSQLELRIASEIFDEPVMREAYLKGEDLHRLTASAMSGIPLDQVTKEQRQKAKAINFGFIYGMYPKTFRLYARIGYGVKMSLDEATRVRARHFSLYRGLQKGHDKVKRQAHALGRVPTLFCRARHLPDLKSPDKSLVLAAERQALNAPVQGTASDLTLFAIVLLEKMLDPKQARIVGMVHDSILMEVKNGTEEKYTKLVKSVMENLPLKETFGFSLRVPLVADVTVGQFWGEEK